MAENPKVAGARVADRARRLWTEVEQRRHHFPLRGFGIDAWDVFLACYLNQIEDQTPTIRELCGQFDLPQTTMLRRIEELEALALIERRKHPLDHRRTICTVTDQGLQRMRDYLKAIAI